MLVVEVSPGGAALEVSEDRDKQGTLLKALLDDEDFRARAGDPSMTSIYNAVSGNARPD